MKSFVFGSGYAVSKIGTCILSGKIERKMRSEHIYWGLYIHCTSRVPNKKRKWLTGGKAGEKEMCSWYLKITL